MKVIRKIVLAGVMTGTMVTGLPTFAGDDDRKDGDVQSNSSGKSLDNREPSTDSENLSDRTMPSDRTAVTSPNSGDTTISSGSATSTQPNQNSSMSGQASSSTSSTSMSDIRSQLTSSKNLRGSAIIGKEITASDGSRKIGEVVDLAVSPRGDISGVIVSLSDLKGVGDRVVAVPWTALDTNKSNDKITLTMSDSQLTQTPPLGELEGDGIVLKMKTPTTP